MMEEELIEAYVVPDPESPLKLKLKIAKSPVRKPIDPGWTPGLSAAMSSDASQGHCHTNDRNLFSALEKLREPTDRMDSSPSCLAVLPTNGEQCYHGPHQPSPKDSGIDMCSPVRTGDEILNSELNGQGQTEKCPEEVNGSSEDSSEDMMVDSHGTPQSEENQFVETNRGANTPNLYLSPSAADPVTVCSSIATHDEPPAEGDPSLDAVNLIPADPGPPSFHGEFVEHPDSGNDSPCNSAQSAEPGPSENCYPPVPSPHGSSSSPAQSDGEKDIPNPANQETEEDADSMDFECTAADLDKVNPDSPLVDVCSVSPCKQHLSEDNNFVQSDLTTSAQESSSGEYPEQIPQICSDLDSSQTNLQNDCTLAALNMSLSQQSVEGQTDCNAENSQSFPADQEAQNLTTPIINSMDHASDGLELPLPSICISSDSDEGEQPVAIRRGRRGRYPKRKNNHSATFFDVFSKFVQESSSPEKAHFERSMASDGSLSDLDVRDPVPEEVSNLQLEPDTDSSTELPAFCAPGNTKDTLWPGYNKECKSSAAPASEDCPSRGKGDSISQSPSTPPQMTVSAQDQIEPIQTCRCCCLTVPHRTSKALDFRTPSSVKRFISSHQKVVRLRKKVVRLCRLLFPQLHYPSRSGWLFSKPDILLDQIIACLDERDLKPRHLQVIPTQDNVMDLRVVLCKSPVSCLRHLRRRLCRLFDLILPDVDLVRTFDRSGPGVDALLHEVLQTNQSS